MLSFFPALIQNLSVTTWLNNKHLRKALVVGLVGKEGRNNQSSFVSSADLFF